MQSLSTMAQSMVQGSQVSVQSYILDWYLKELLTNKEPVINQQNMYAAICFFKVREKNLEEEIFATGFKTPSEEDYDGDDEFEEETVRDILEEAMQVIQDLDEFQTNSQEVNIYLS